MSGGITNSFQAGDLYQNGQPYPWLVEFRNPRDPLSQGLATGGSGSFVDAVDDFVADKVRPGDTIINVSTGGRGNISNVTATRIFFFALAGGSDAEFDAGETYRVEAAFTSEPGRRNGLIPVGQRPNEIFKTGFTVKWDFSHIHDLVDDSGGAGSGLVPDISERGLLSDWVLSEDGVDDGTDPAPLVIGPDEGYCRWTVESRVDCYGRTVDSSFVRKDLKSPVTVQRTIEVNIAFDASGTDPADPAPFAGLPAVVVNPPTATSPRTRDLSVSRDFLSTMIPPPPGGWPRN